MVHYQTDPVRNAPVTSHAVPVTPGPAACPGGHPQSAHPVGGRKDGGAVTPQLPLPSGQSSLTPEWLTQVLRQAGAIDAGRVAEVSVEPVGTGQVADCFRCRLSYDDAEPRAPRSVIAKLPAEDPTSRETAVAQIRNSQKMVLDALMSSPRLLSTNVVDLRPESSPVKTVRARRRPVAGTAGGTRRGPSAPAPRRSTGGRRRGAPDPAAPATRTSRR